MKSKNKLIGLGYFVFILLSCVPETSISTDNITIKPTAMTSDIPIMITSNPSSLPVVSTSSPMAEDLSKYEKYPNKFYCKLPEENTVAKLDMPIDLAVTKDGKTIYVTNNIKSPMGGGTNVFSDRPYIYKITDNKKISIIRTQEDYSRNCNLIREIEIDNDNNLYSYYPVYEELKITDGSEIINRTTLPFIREYKIIKISDEKNLSIRGNIQIPYPRTVSNYQNSATFPLIKDLGNLYVSKKDKEVYFGISYSSIIFSEDAINKLQSSSETEIIYPKKSDSLYQTFRSSSFLVENNKLYLPYSFVNLNSSDKKLQEFIPFQDNRISPTKMKMNSKGEIIAGFNKSYDEAPIKNRIMKIVPGEGVFNLAGNGNAGFKDGKGDNAEFNNPVGLDIDAQDNIYVADTGNNAIRKITPDGEVTTFYKEGN